MPLHELRPKEGIALLAGSSRHHRAGPGAPAAAGAAAGGPGRWPRAACSIDAAGVPLDAAYRPAVGAARRATRAWRMRSGVSPGS